MLVAPWPIARQRSPASPPSSPRSLALAAGAEPLRVGSKRFTESYILGEILAQSAARAGAAVEHRPGLGNTAILFEALSQRGHRRLPRVHGHDRARDPQGGRAPRPRGTQPPAGPAGARGESSPGILQRLRAGRARKCRRREGHRDRLGPRAPCGPGPRALARVPAARGRVAGAEGRVRAAAREPARPRPRARLRGARRRAGRRDRPVHDGREDRALRRAGAGRRPRLLPALRRGGAAPPRQRRAPPGRLRRVEGARRAARRARDDPPQRARGAGLRPLRPRGVRVPRRRRLRPGRAASGRRSSRPTSRGSPSSTRRWCSPRWRRPWRWACRWASSPRGCAPSRSRCSRWRASCRRCRRWHSSPSSSRSPASARRRRCSRSSSTRCCPSRATPTRGSRAFPRGCATAALALGLTPAAGAGAGSSCRWRCR